MHLRPECVCLSLTLWEFQIGMQLYCISYANACRDNCEKQNPFRKSKTFNYCPAIKQYQEFCVLECDAVQSE